MARMAWKLTGWLALVRGFQLLALFAAGAMNGFLVAWIHLKDLGLGRNIVVLEILIVGVLTYTSLALILQHTSNRSKRLGWLICFILGDALSIGGALAVITILARAGLPTMCAGLTDNSFIPDRPDFQGIPGSTYTTNGFSDMAEGRTGALDKYCAFERSIFFIAIALIFTAMGATVLSILRICECNYTKNTQVSEMLESLDRANDKDQQSPLLMTTARFVPPPSEGVITRQTSLRSVSTTTHGDPVNTSLPAIPRRPVPNRTSAAVVIPSSIDEELEARNGAEEEQYHALVADGMRPGLQRTGQRHSISAAANQESTVRQQQQTSLLLAEDDRSLPAEDAVVADGMRYASNSQHQQAHGYTPVPHALPPLDEESAALVSDGSRPMPNLPPYSDRGSAAGGPARADGTVLQLNEYRGSSARIQDMKSTGYFKE